ncbi:MAG: ABC transporter permease subunit [Methylobacteriaceae bacterium]|jgi:dipeptide transport system permease protein|nr:ABC transporter permease subunit [Methylobacteriaceae bacterium]
MLRYIFGKLLYLVPTFLGITIVAFGMIRLLPGDPVIMLAGERGVTPERHAELLAMLGMDKPIWEQYFIYVWNLLHGDFGISFSSKESVLTEFFARFPATLELGLCAMIIAVIVGIPVGVFAAIKRGSWFDQVSMTGALVGYSMPIFWWGLLLIMLFSVFLNLTPVSGRIDLLYFFDTPTGFMLIDSWLSGEKGAFASAVSHLILPSVVLSTIPLAVIARQTRSAMLEVLNEDYVRTARAKGLSPWRVIGLHTLRNALIPVVTTIGLQVSVIITGAVLTENIFSWPGIGKWMVDAVWRRDYFVIQGGLILICVNVMIVNLLVDVLYALINPRIRYS